MRSLTSYIRKTWVSAPRRRLIKAHDYCYKCQCHRRDPSIGLIPHKALEWTSDGENPNRESYSAQYNLRPKRRFSVLNSGPIQVSRNQNKTNDEHSPEGRAVGAEIPWSVRWIQRRNLFLRNGSCCCQIKSDDLGGNVLHQPAEVV